MRPPRMSGRREAQFAPGWTVGPALLAVVVVTALGTEAKGAIFGASPAVTSPAAPSAPR
jgi:hypothetical protein